MVDKLFVTLACVIAFYVLLPVDASARDSPPGPTPAPPTQATVSGDSDLVRSPSLPPASEPPKPAPEPPTKTLPLPAYIPQGTSSITYYYPPQTTYYAPTPITYYSPPICYQPQVSRPPSFTLNSSLRICGPGRICP